MIDQDGSSSKEAVEINNLSGVEISDSYFQDKGFYVAIWGGTTNGGARDNFDINIHNNIFANVARPVTFGFGNSAGVFIPDGANDITIQNNVFDNMGNALQLGGSGFDVRNNVFQNSQGDDVTGGSNITFTHNLKNHADPQKQSWVVSTSVDATNVRGNPGFNGTGQRWEAYYQTASGTSLLVDRGTDVGLPYAGSAPDIGRWEYAPPATRTAQASSPLNHRVVLYPNPTLGRINVSSSNTISEVKIIDLEGKLIFKQTVDYQRSAVIDLPNQRPGIYSIMITHDEGVEVRKLVVSDKGHTP